MRQLYLYMFDVIVLFFISLPGWPNINTLCTMVDCERFSAFRVDHGVQKSGHLWATVTVNTEPCQVMLETSSSTWFAMIPKGLSNCPHSADLDASSQDSISRNTHFSFRVHIWPVSFWSCSTRLPYLGLRQKRGIRNMSCQYWWLQTENSGVHSTDS